MKYFTIILLVSLLAACGNTVTVSEPAEVDHTENKDTVPIPKDSSEVNPDSATRNK
jgi:hypothetical protein